MLFLKYNSLILFSINVYNPSLLNPDSEFIDDVNVDFNVDKL